MPAFADQPAAMRHANENVVSAETSLYAINLPSSAQTTEADADYVCRSLLEILEGTRLARTA